MWPCVTLNGALGLYRLGTMPFRDDTSQPCMALCSPRWDWCLSQTVLPIVVRISERSRSGSRK